MKLERCPACKRMVSLEAQSCPKCGHPLDDVWREKARNKGPFTKRRLPMTLFILAIWGVIAWQSLDFSTGESGLKVRAAEYGADWGFIPDELSVECRNVSAGGVKRPHVLVISGGVTFALNGAAISDGTYPNARKIMMKDKDGLYTFKGPTEVLNRGIAMCP